MNTFNIIDFLHVTILIIGRKIRENEKGEEEKC